MIVFGIDPDSQKHGVAIYKDGVLTSLMLLELFDLIDMIESDFSKEIFFSIEDVCANNFVYARNEKANKYAHAKVSLSIGRCQQSQTELMRVLTHLGYKYVLHKPQKGNWAKNKAQFEKITGWKKQSNEDTRSAAYFGFLECS